MTTELAPQAAPEHYLLFDRADDDAVLARIRGASLAACVYHFREGGQELYGLGIDGAEECKREMARQGEVIEEEDVQIEREIDDALFLKARASRWAVKVNGEAVIRVKLDSAIGVKRQSKLIHRRDGTTQPNAHYWEQGCAKAMRNAILRLTPQALQQKVIDAFRGAGAADAHPDHPRHHPRRAHPGGEGAEAEGSLARLARRGPDESGRGGSALAS